MHLSCPGCFTVWRHVLASKGGPLATVDVALTIALGEVFFAVACHKDGTTLCQNQGPPLGLRNGANSDPKGCPSTALALRSTSYGVSGGDQARGWSPPARPREGRLASPPTGSSDGRLSSMAESRSTRSRSSTRYRGLISPTAPTSPRPPPLTATREPPSAWRQ